MDIEVNENWEEWDPKSVPFYVHMISGISGGVTEHAVMFPVDTLKTHYQVSNAEGIKDNAFKLAYKMVKQKGFIRLWKGVSTVLLACIPSHAVYFTVYEQFKSYFTSKMPARHESLAISCAGVGATALHDLCMTPFDVIKQRLQIGEYNGRISKAFHQIFKVEGVGTLFRSYPTTLILGVPYSAIMLPINEWLKKKMNPSGKLNPVVFFLSGGIAGSAAAALTCPLDVVKTRLQTQHVKKHEVWQNKTEINVELHKDFYKVLESEYGIELGELKGKSRKEIHALYHKVKRERKRRMLPDPVHHVKAHLNYKGRVMAEIHDNRMYYGLIDTSYKIFKNEGLLSFFRGVGPRALFNFPAVGLSWGTYESVKRILFCLGVFDKKEKR